jgi:hypothetical protein
METLTRRPRPVQNSMKKKIDWEVVGVVLFIFTLFPFVWFYRELIQQTYEIRRNHGKDRWCGSQWRVADSQNSVTKGEISAAAAGYASEQRKLPAGVPTTFLTLAWRKLIGIRPTIDRRTWEVAVMVALRDRLRDWSPLGLPNGHARR